MLNSENNWEIGIENSQSNIRWIPIATVEFTPDYKRRIGISEHGVWVNTIERGTPGNHLSLVVNCKDCYTIMAILEKERAEIEDLIKKGLEQNHLREDLFYTFPFKELIKFTLVSSSNYWGLKAISWIREGEFDEELVEISNRIIEEKKLDQKSRHYLFKLVQRFKKEKSGGKK